MTDEDLVEAIARALAHAFNFARGGSLVRAGYWLGCANERSFSIRDRSVFRRAHTLINLSEAVLVSIEERS